MEFALKKVKTEGLQELFVVGLKMKILQNLGKEKYRKRKVLPFLNIILFQML